MLVPREAHVLSQDVSKALKCWCGPRLLTTSGEDVLSQMEDFSDREVEVELLGQLTATSEQLFAFIIHQEPISTRRSRGRRGWVANPEVNTLGYS